MVASKVGGSIQFGTTVFQRYLSGFSFPSNSTYTLSSIPPANSQGIVPGSSGLNFAAFDQATVPGVTSPANRDDEGFYLADDGLTLSNILINKYTAVGTNPGIAILFQNMVTAAGASTTFLALACANVSGTALTYQATGTTLYTDNLQALTSLSASSAALSTSLTVYSASGMYPGDYIFVNPSGLTQENPKITAISGNTLTITGLNFDHLANEYVAVNGRKFFGRCLIPPNTLGGVTQNYVNIVLTVDCLSVSR